MQSSRIHPQQWYQTKQGAGKCLSTAGKRLKFLIDGKEVWLASSEVQHEIAKGEEPQLHDEPAFPDARAILTEINEFFRHNNPVNPSALFNERWTFKEAIELCLANHIEGQ